VRRALAQSWSRVSGHRVAVGLVVLALGFLALVLYVVPAALVGPDDELTAAERLKAENDVRTTLFQALAGAALLAGLYFTGRTFQLNREGQVTDRFTRAIDQLGNETLDVRLGGIYALERIAQSSRRDHGSIVEVLTAFVREHGRWQDADADDPGANEPAGRGDQGEEGSGADDEEPRPAGDVQAILTVLGRRRAEWDGERLDLRQTDLRGANLRGAHLEGADLRAARLKAADLTDAHLEDALLMEAQLEDARLTGAHLVGANLNNASLEDAWLDGADLDRAILMGARLAGAQLSYATIRGANLELAPLRGAVLHGADLRGTWLSMSHLDGAFIDERTKLPALSRAFMGRIWLADQGVGTLVAIANPDERPPSSEFRDMTETFRFESEATEPTGSS